MRTHHSSHGPQEHGAKRAAGPFTDEDGDEGPVPRSGRQEQSRGRQGVESLPPHGGGAPTPPDAETECQQRRRACATGGRPTLVRACRGTTGRSGEAIVHGWRSVCEARARVSYLRCGYEEPTSSNALCENTHFPQLTNRTLRATLGSLQVQNNLFGSAVQWTDMEALGGGETG